MSRSLASRIALLVVAVVAATVVVAGVLAAELVRQTSTSSARQQLARLADTAETRADRGDQRAALLRVKRLLRTLDIQLAVLNANGRVAGGPAVAAAVTEDDIADLRAGKEVSAQRKVLGKSVFVEARPTANGGVVLVQRRSEALAAGERSVRRMLLALLVGVAIAIPASIVLARALARPLRRTAQAAHALAEGHRDVQVPVEGPEEVADVADSVNAIAAALQRSEAQQRTFLMSVSHDLRTPLTAIRGYAESMRDGALEGDMRGIGDVLTGESLRLERLVDDLLDLARLQADRFRVDLAETDVADLVAETGRAWQERCRSAGVPFAVANEGRARVVTDAARVRQVLDGLLENALRMTPSGAPLVLASSVVGAEVLFEVRDGGPGLAPEDLSDAFRPGVLHERYRGVRPVGTGLGLAIAAGLVTRLGGTIEAGTAPEGGARFTVRLPLPPDR
jgi:two-component system, OmpR family, sensor kinase